MGKINKARVNDLHQVMNGYIECGEIPGIVTLIAQGDDVYVDAMGTMRQGGSEPMKRDTIFRLASITKPITGVATMILVDDGTIGLDDAVEKWLPELANRRVLRRIDSELDDTVPAKRSVTVRDLLTFCWGFGSIMAMPDTYPIQRPIAEGRLGSDGPMYLINAPETDTWMRRMGELPLMYQPGEQWLYNAGTDVLGVLIGRASGKSFGQFLQERLFDPLGMKDTGFSVPASKLDRLPMSYTVNMQTQAFEVFDSADDSKWSRPAPIELGSGGLVSTAEDYFALCRMLLDKGTWRGERILSAESVAAMTRDQVTPEQRKGMEIFFGNHSSWGLGVSVNIHQVEPWQVPGRFGWDGGFGTSAYSDPTNDFVGIFLSQRLMASPEPPPQFNDFWQYAYRTLE